NPLHALTRNKPSAFCEAWSRVLFAWAIPPPPSYQEFDWEVEPLVPAPDKMEEEESPKQKAPATKPRKKRRVYSL
ncbi:MAG: hypothetical protein AAFV25_16960, partial [Bacteroidota bacterium]